MFSNIFNGAKAHIRGSKDFHNIDGTVDFRETKNGVLLTAKIQGLPNSKDRCTGRFFGFHIHERWLLYWKC